MKTRWRWKRWSLACGNQLLQLGRCTFRGLWPGHILSEALENIETFRENHNLCSSCSTRSTLLDALWDVHKYTECVDMILDASSTTRKYLFRSRETHPASCEISEALWILHLFDFAVVQLFTLLFGHVTFELENFANVLPLDLSAA